MTDWDTLCDRRFDLVREFATTVATAVARVDTEHPAFHGCFDWHSAVHGTYALLAGSRLTGDPSFAEAALAANGDARVRDEVTALADGRLDKEIPYGLAWALILDAEANRSGVTMFRRLAEACRDRLIAHLGVLSIGGRLIEAATDEEYPNAIWPAIALLRWGRAIGDACATDEAGRVAVAIRSAFAAANLPGSAGIRSPAAGRGFFSPVHLAVLLTADAGWDGPADAAPRGRRAASSDVAALLGGTGFPAGLFVASDMPTVHSAGLNFSRAWGLHAAWRVTREARWREHAAGLILGHVAMPERWRDDYARYAHWIPQFGIFAIAETFDAE